MSTANRAIEATEEERAALRLLFNRRARERQANRQAEPANIVDWAASRFYVAESGEDDDTAGIMRGKPIVLAPHQSAILRYVFQPGANGRQRFSTVVWSTSKKGGKTTISALVARYVAETKGPFAEVYAVGNDFEQAKSRSFGHCLRSVVLTPGYDYKRRELPGQWRALEREMQHLPTGGKVKALATDYKGEAGSEPTLTVWTELWGYLSENSQRFWTEMTPTPTRRFSMRWVETYAGFQGESKLLELMYNTGMERGRQITAGELGDLSAFAESPNPDSLVPIWVNEPAGLFMYWDTGPASHRMPWQQGAAGDAYYAEQATQLTESQFRRLHLNEWVSPEGEAIPIAWWDNCLDPLRLAPGGKTPVVIGVDASVSGDSTALSCVARHPEKHDELVEFHTVVWYPSAGEKMDYDATLTPEVDRLIEQYNVVQVAYDEYQLHHWANEQRKKVRSTWYRSFNQGADRLLADKGLYDLVKERKLHHSGNAELRKHVQDCAAKIPPKEANKMRFVKKSEGAKIDGCVALSMAAYECLRLSL